MKYLVVVVVALLLFAGVALWVRGRHALRVRSAIVRLTGSHGAARCLAAIDLLRDLRHAPGPAVAAAWDHIELPLLEALSDCPPANKVALRQALEECSQACAHRETAKRIMTMRDALIGAAPDRNNHA